MKGSNFETWLPHNFLGRNILYSRPTNKLESNLTGPTSMFLWSCSFFCQQLLLLCFRHLQRFLLKVLSLWFKLHVIRYDYHCFMSHIGPKKIRRSYGYINEYNILNQVALKARICQWKNVCTHFTLMMKYFFLHWWTCIFCGFKRWSLFTGNYFTSTPTPILWRYGHFAYLKAEPGAGDPISNPQTLISGCFQ